VPGKGEPQAPQNFVIVLSLTPICIGLQLLRWMHCLGNVEAHKALIRCASLPQSGLPAAHTTVASLL
jgi:hypothetical protein